MVQTCSAYGCKNRYHKEREISFHKFPLARPDVCGQWVAAMRRNNFRPTKYSNICSQHFTNDCFKGECNNRVLKENAVPSLFAFSLSIKSEPLENPFPSEIHFPLSLPLTTDTVMVAGGGEEEEVEEEEEEQPQPEQEKSAADALGDTATVSCDHNYTAEDSVRQTRRIKYLEDQLERLRKKMKSTQQRCRRQERQLSRLRAVCKLPKSPRPVPMPFGQDYVIVPKQMFNNLSGIE